jgi:hypothetical protein
VIVRISTEAQYELDEAAVAELNQLDNAAVEVCDAGDEAAFHRVYAELLDFVRSRGHELSDDDLRSSELILPPPDVSLEEARSEFTGDGLIPG